MTVQSRQSYDRITASCNYAGFTLIELLIIIATIAVVLTLALPVMSKYSIRSKMEEALAVTAAARSAVDSACRQDAELAALTNSTVGYRSRPSQWVDSVTISGSCSAPVIRASTRDTGAPNDPAIVLTGSVASPGAQLIWACTSTAENSILPEECRD